MWWKSLAPEFPDLPICATAQSLLRPTPLSKSRKQEIELLKSPSSPGRPVTAPALLWSTGVEDSFQTWLEDALMKSKKNNLRREGLDFKARVALQCPKLGEPLQRAQLQGGLKSISGGRMSISGSLRRSEMEGTGSSTASFGGKPRRKLLTTLEQLKIIKDDLQKEVTGRAAALDEAFINKTSFMFLAGRPRRDKASKSLPRDSVLATLSGLKPLMQFTRKTVLQEQRGFLEGLEIAKRLPTRLSSESLGEPDATIQAP